ncbi:MAG: AbrB/MazE/SpoVT family DNA-binding domain-containing protein [Candidatus Dormibacteraeota bacterium]|nr:AbrB/MazE/SpoVT family DNA-binding domain-containing protein [Candidatus Dormibacteraeota bacterium]
MRVTLDRGGRLVLPKPIRDAVGLAGGEQVEVRLAGVVIEIEPIQPRVRVRTRPGRLPVLAVDGETQTVTADDVRVALQAQREEREERWR